MIKKVIKGQLSDVVQQTITDQDDIEITDFPIGGITNLQMQQALTEDYAGFYQVGSVYLCTDNGNYGTKTHLYKFNGTSWEDVTPSGEEIDLSDYVKKENESDLTINAGGLFKMSSDDEIVITAHEEPVDIYGGLVNIVSAYNFGTVNAKQAVIDMESGIARIDCVNRVTNSRDSIHLDTSTNKVEINSNDTTGSSTLKITPTKVTIKKGTGTEKEVATVDNIPTQYLKTASVSDNTLTITKQDGTTVEFEGGGDIDLSDYVKKTNDEQVDITTPILTVTSQGDLGATQMVLISDIGANAFQVASSDTNGNVAGLYVSATQDSIGVKVYKGDDFVDVATVDDIPDVSNLATKSELADKVSQTDLDEVYENINRIDGYIPSETSTTNQLADKNFVNSSIATNTANFKGTFTSTAQLPTTDVTNNDYAFVQETDTAGNIQYKRYKYNAGDTEWVYEYTLNNSSFTAGQWATINSGVTSSTISNINTAMSEIDADISRIDTDVANLAQNKQPKGDYALKSEIPDVSGFVSGTADVNATANTLVKRDANGHINANYVQGSWGKFTTSATSEQGNYIGIAVYNSGGWLYKRSLENLKNDLAIPDTSGFALKTDLAGYATTTQAINLSNSITAVDTKVNNLIGTCDLLGYRSGTGTISLSSAITNYKWIVLVNAQNDDGSGYWKSPTYLPVSFITGVGYGREYAFHNVDNSSYRIKFNNSSQAQVTAEYYGRRIMVYGVK